MPTAQQIQDSLTEVRQELLAARTPRGHWEGRLASSALSTATAVSAISLIQRHSQDGSEQAAERSKQRCQCIQAGLQWLAQQQNSDGGFGDTDLSHSNIATSMLIAAAIRLAGEPQQYHAMLARCDEYIDRQGGIPALRKRYGKDKTFAVPILTNCALAGMVDWKDVSPLPFELAVFPQGFFRFLKLPVVSYAIPALVAIGQARYFHRKPLNPLVRGIRKAAVGKSLRVLESIQPESGGYLEATPLTAFVTMSLASIGHADHAIARRGEDFLFASMRDDGSWPIDTNLATWNTTLSLNALLPDEDNSNGGLNDDLADVLQPALLDWLLSCQHREIHPYTGALPGGWAWTDLSGGVPDVDDTSGALLALAKWRHARSAREELSTAGAARLNESATAGVGWLLDLQNRDGGWPTFCRGWGTMPFDRSATDLTAHAIRAMHAWRSSLSESSELQRRIAAATARGFRFLTKSQDECGSWTPLWFGNQDQPAEENPIYGTARVLLVYADLAADLGDEASKAAAQGLRWLHRTQNEDGGWGGNGQQSSVEETALSVETIARFVSDNSALSALLVELNSELESALQGGVGWLVGAIRENCHRKPSPIGFYFAKLWYYEDLYPLIFTAAALRAAAQTAGAFANEQSAAPLAASAIT